MHVVLDLLLGFIMIRLLYFLIGYYYAGFIFTLTSLTTSIRSDTWCRARFEFGLFCHGRHLCALVMIPLRGAVVFFYYIPVLLPASRNGIAFNTRQNLHPCTDLRCETVVHYVAGAIRWAYFPGNHVRNM